MATDDDMVRVRGARVHNLRDVDVSVPRDALVAFTGVSGSGKSSLAFGTIYAEAQRRYMESVAPYARRLLTQVDAPDVDGIDGLPPAVALSQRRGAPSSRSSVGTLTATSNALRMLFSRAGTYADGSVGGGDARLDSDAFSPNTAVGACPACQGLGEVHEVTEASLVPDPSLSIADRAVAAWPGAWQGKNQRDILAVLGHDIHAPWHSLSQHARDWILFTEEQPVVVVDPVREVGRTQRPYKGQFMSARRYVMRTLAESKSAPQRARAMQFVETTPCPTCGGTRLRVDALAVTFAGRSIAEATALPMRDLADLLRPTARETDGASDDAVADAAALLARDVVDRVDALVGLGLGYLSLDRPTTTLSAGEHQRLRLATQLRSGLFGVVYVLDEPSAGLHPVDAEPLLDLLEGLQQSGNSLFVVEHDMDVVRRADWIVDVGVGAGEGGGQVLYSGPLAGLECVERSVTRQYLFPPAGGELPRAVRTPTGAIELRDLTRHNLQGLDLDLPRGVLTAVTGASGSGKSTLVALLAERAERGELAGVDRLVSVDQAPIGRTPRSNLATYTGLFDAVRKVFAATPEARARGWNAGRFSFNVAGGRCETCQGEGFVAVELLFLPGTYARCPTCHGARYEPGTLEVEWNGRTIAGVLDLTVDAAADVFAEVPAAARAIAALRAVGLGYLRLGQPATELSGGEAQRIKLASELQRTTRGHVLYLLDEPTTGLHPADTALLLAQLHRLVDAGHTVVVVEHELGVVASADHVVDLGPGGGDDGGRVVATGTPAEVAAAPGSRTAPYLARRLATRA